jgi:hypothetical protein
MIAATVASTASSVVPARAYQAALSGKAPRTAGGRTSIARNERNENKPSATATGTIAYNQLSGFVQTQ